MNTPERAGSPTSHADDLGSDYDARKQEERRAYDSCAVVHDLPAIYHYWSDKFVRPKLVEVGFRGIKELFCDVLLRHCEAAPRTARFLSIGSGNSDQEIEFATALRAAGHSNFVIDCLDSNEVMQERGRAAADQRNLSGRIAFIAADFNRWEPQREYDAVLAIQSLHHVVNLEGLFSGVKRCLRGDFVISDMIGRNGHRRWPEALAIVHEFWRQLPSSYRFNQRLERYEEMFEDWDCSLEGFEGIRSQDILPLLIEHFQFSVFVGYGNVIDPFVDRSFGGHFDVNARWDRAFIDAVHARDEQALNSGNITPTHMLAILTQQDGLPVKHTGSLSPASCVRRPDGPHFNGRVEGGANEARLHDLLSEVKRLQDERLKLRSEWAERTEWAMRLDRELEEMTARVLDFRTELQTRTAWALRLDEDLRQRTEWALRLQSENEALRAIIDAKAGSRLKKLGKRLFASLSFGKTR